MFLLDESRNMYLCTKDTKTLAHKLEIYCFLTLTISFVLIWRMVKNIACLGDGFLFAHSVYIWWGCFWNIFVTLWSLCFDFGINSVLLSSKKPAEWSDVLRYFSGQNLHVLYVFIFQLSCLMKTVYCVMQPVAAYGV